MFFQYLILVQTLYNPILLSHTHVSVLILSRSVRLQYSLGFGTVIPVHRDYVPYLYFSNVGFIRLTLLRKRMIFRGLLGVQNQE